MEIDDVSYKGSWVGSYGSLCPSLAPQGSYVHRRSCGTLWVPLGPHESSWGLMRPPCGTSGRLGSYGYSWDLRYPEGPHTVGHYESPLGSYVGKCLYRGLMGVLRFLMGPRGPMRPHDNSFDPDFQQVSPTVSSRCLQAQLTSCSSLRIP